jgi:hypothetical protein
VLHHDGEEFHDDLAGRADQDLTLTAAFSVDDAVQRVVQNAHEHHGDGLMAAATGTMAIWKR